MKNSHIMLVNYFEQKSACIHFDLASQFYLLIGEKYAWKLSFCDHWRKKSIKCVQIFAIVCKVVRKFFTSTS